MSRIDRQGGRICGLYPRIMQASVKKNNGASFARMKCFRDGVAPMAIASA
jgi:hypothetical protein